MADIDMIPRSYCNALNAQRALVRYGAALTLLLVAGGAAAGALRWRLALETPRLERLRTDAARAGALHTQIAAAEQRRALLAANARAYAALRGTGSAAALARALDTALGEKIWLERLSFDRKHELLQSAADAAPVGTLQVSTSGPAGSQQWRIINHIDIDGHALDQAALAAFLAALSASPALADVRFIDSSAAATEGGLLAFRAAATLRQQEKAP
jgi:Tfp pilus assembly protein PilN